MKKTAELSLYSLAQWLNNSKTRVHTTRILTALSDEEVGRFVKDSLLDVVGSVDGKAKKHLTFSSDGSMFYEYMVNENDEVGLHVDRLIEMIVEQHLEERL